MVVKVRSHVSALNWSYAMRKSLAACAATEFPALIVHVTGQLVWVMAVPGDTPTFPLTVALVQVTAVPARIAKLDAAPSEGADDAALVTAFSREVANEGALPRKRDEASGRRKANVAFREAIVRAPGLGFRCMFATGSACRAEIAPGALEAHLDRCDAFAAGRPQLAEERDQGRHVMERVRLVVPQGRLPVAELRFHPGEGRIETHGVLLRGQSAPRTTEPGRHPTHRAS